MNYKPSFTTEGGVSVSEHWHNGACLKKGIFLNLFFYNITKKHLGTTIVATVEVIEKTLSTGEAFLMLNIHHTPDRDVHCEWTFRMPKNGTGDFEIHPDVEEKIFFQPRKHNRIRL